MLRERYWTGLGGRIASRRNRANLPVAERA
jgi:hypothetical protein